MNHLCKTDCCTGCAACLTVCSQNAITMRKDWMGFSFPQIDSDKCVNCGKCDKACQALHPVEKNTPIVIYKYKGEDEQRLRSSSGAAFPLIAYYFLDKGYYIAGVVFDDMFQKAKYILTQSKADVERMRKSKYLEPELGDVFVQVKTLLCQEKKVLFVGLPCHVAGLKRFLQHWDGLITIDLLCFGAGSPELYRQNLNAFVKQHNHKMEELSLVDFRHKPFVDEEHTILDIQFGDETYSLKAAQFPYYYGFVNHLLMRESCYACRYHCFERCADITIGDAIGHRDALGESIILCNTIHGHAIMQALNADGKLKEMDAGEIEETKSRFFPRVKPAVYESLRNCNSYEQAEKTYLNRDWHNKKQDCVFYRVRKAIITRIRLVVTFLHHREKK